MVLYGITLVLLAEKQRDTDTIVLSPFHADDTLIYGSVRRSVVQLQLIIDQGTYQG